MMSFITVIPFAHIVAEKHFVKLARQAQLGANYSTELHTFGLEFYLLDLSAQSGSSRAGERLPLGNGLILPNDRFQGASPTSTGL